MSQAVMLLGGIYTGTEMEVEDGVDEIKCYMPGQSLNKNGKYDCPDSKAQISLVEIIYRKSAFIPGTFVYSENQQR